MGTRCKYAPASEVEFWPWCTKFRPWKVSLCSIIYKSSFVGSSAAAASAKNSPGTWLSGRQRWLPRETMVQSLSQKPNSLQYDSKRIILESETGRLPWLASLGTPQLWNLFMLHLHNVRLPHILNGLIRLYHSNAGKSETKWHMEDQIPIAKILTIWSTLSLSKPAEGARSRAAKRKPPNPEGRTGDWRMKQSSRSNLWNESNLPHFHGRKLVWNKKASATWASPRGRKHCW